MKPMTAVQLTESSFFMQMLAKAGGLEVVDATNIFHGQFGHHRDFHTHLTLASHLIIFIDGESDVFFRQGTFGA